MIHKSNEELLETIRNLLDKVDYQLEPLVDVNEPYSFEEWRPHLRGTGKRALTMPAIYYVGFFKNESAYELFALLIEHGASIETVELDGVYKPLIHHYIEHGNIELQRRLIELDPTIIDDINDDGETPLHILSKSYENQYMGRITPVHRIDLIKEQIQLYLNVYEIDGQQYEANVNAVDKYGNTFLHLLAHYVTLFPLLCEDFFDFSRVDINAVNNAGQTPLHICYNKYKRLSHGDDILFHRYDEIQAFHRTFRTLIESLISLYEEGILINHIDPKNGLSTEDILHERYLYV
jgi:hypothetical protein